MTYTDFEQSVLRSMHPMSDSVLRALEVLCRGNVESWVIVQYLLSFVADNKLDELDYYRELRCTGETAEDDLFVDLGFNVNNTYPEHPDILSEWKCSWNINTLSDGVNGDVQKFCAILPYYYARKGRPKPYPVVVAIGASGGGSIGPGMHQHRLTDGISVYLSTQSTWSHHGVLPYTAFVRDSEQADTADQFGTSR